MPDLTPRLGIKKPLGNENVTRAAFNENYDIIDANVATRAEGQTAQATADAALAAAQAAQAKADAAQSKADAALPKTGGTLTGPISVPSTLTIRKENNTGEGGQFVLEGSNGNPDWFIDVYNNQLRFMPDWADRLRIAPNDMFFNGARVWNANNDGAGSGLDADTVHGMVPQVNSVGSTIVVRLSDGSINTNGVNVYDGKDLQLFAAGGSNDAGDVVFLDGNKNEIGRFWLDHTSNTFMVRPGAAGGYSLWTSQTLRNNNGVLEFWTGGAWQPVGGIKGVQRGYTSINFGVNNTAKYHDISINTVNPSKTQLNLLTLLSNYYNRSDASIRLINATTIRVQWTFSTNPNDDWIPISWEVIEYY